MHETFGVDMPIGACRRFDLHAAVQHTDAVSCCCCLSSVFLFLSAFLPGGFTGPWTMALDVVYVGRTAGFSVRPGPLTARLECVTRES